MSKVLLYVSSFFIAHASFSAYEFVSSTKRSATITSKSIPLDIIVELIIAAVIFCLATVFHAKQTPLKLVQRSAWASTQSYPENSRPGFIDIVKRRREYTVKDQAKLS